MSTPSDAPATETPATPAAAAPEGASQTSSTSAPGNGQVLPKSDATEEAPPATAAPGTGDRLNERFAALSRKAQEVFQKEQSLAAERALIEEGKRAKAELELAKTDLRGFLAKQGVALDDLLSTMAEDTRSPEQKAADEVRERLERMEKAQKEREAADTAARHQRAIEQYRTSVNETIQSGGDRFELCAAWGDHAIELAQSVSAHWLNELGELPSLDEVLDVVEAELETRSRPIASAKKLAPKPPAAPAAPAPVPGTPQSNAAPPVSTSPMRTITQDHVPESSPVDLDEMTDSERIAFIAKKYATRKAG